MRPKTAPRSPTYVGHVTGGTAGALYLFGWTGDFGDADNFVGTFFQAPSAQWGFENDEIFSVLDAARSRRLPRSASSSTRTNRKIMEFLPGVPYVHTKPALAYAAEVSGYVPGQVSLESFATVELNGG